MKGEVKKNMASSNVRFFFGTLAKYQALETKDPLALYFVTDEETGRVYLFKGSQLYASDAIASTIADGWMSKEDKINLDNLVANAVTNLAPVDGSIIIVDGNKIGVALSAEAGNILSLKSDGLYVDASGSIDVPEYSIEKQAVADEGFNATYKLKKTVGSESSYVGDAISIPKDLVISSGSLEVVAEAGVPYDGAVVGEPYLDIVLNNADSEHIYIPVKGLVDTYKAGAGLQLVDGTFSVNLGSDTNGLHFVDGTLNLALATKDSAGAMSATDKAFIDSIPETYVSKAEMNAITQRVKYEVFSKPVGTTARIMDNEIRICCAADTAWTEQAVGSNGNPDRFYVGLKVYAPVGTDHFMEDLNKTIEDTTIFDFTDEFSGRDAYGNGYSLVWLPVAAKQEDGTWKYYGDNSTESKMIGWYYTGAFYDASDNLLSKETIRINLVNENMGTETIPYYMNSYATKEDIEALENNISWGEL